MTWRASPFRQPIGATMRSPSHGCSRISLTSSGVSGPCFMSTWVGMAIMPMSCSRKPPASCGSCVSSGAMCSVRSQREPHDAVGVGRRLAEGAAAVVVQLECAGEPLDDAGDRRGGDRVVRRRRVARGLRLGFVVDCEHRLPLLRWGGRLRRGAARESSACARPGCSLDRGIRSARSPHAGVESCPAHDGDRGRRLDFERSAAKRPWGFCR